MKAFLKSAAFLIGYVWSFPLTLIGFCLAWFGSCTFLKEDGWCFIFKAEKDGYAMKLFEALGKGAFTTGAVIILRDISYLRNKRLIAHEKRHFHQALVFGLLMVPLYYGASLVLWIIGKRPYEDNPFELDAERYGLKAA